MTMRPIATQGGGDQVTISSSRQKSLEFAVIYIELDLCSSGKIRVRIFLTQIPTSNIQIQDQLRWSWSILFKV